MKMTKRRWTGAGLIGLSFLTMFLLLYSDIFPKKRVSDGIFLQPDGSAISASANQVQLPPWLGITLFVTIIVGILLLVWPRHKKTNA